jgi:hypothetical protein
MNLFADFIIYPYLIPDDISERGLISIEVVPNTTLLAGSSSTSTFLPELNIIHIATLVCVDLYLWMSPFEF